VFVKYLSATQPTDPGAGAIGNYALVNRSDDYRKYKDIFANTASDLIASGRCTAQDFKETGWVKSINQKDSPVYFVYCGGMDIQHRLYLNAATGDVFQ
jgi:hypothetical protein